MTDLPINFCRTLQLLFDNCFLSHFVVTVPLCDINFHTKVSKKDTVNQLLWEGWNSIQSAGDSNADHMITWQIKNVIAQLSQRLKSKRQLSKVVGVYIRTKHYHPYISRDVVWWYLDVRNGCYCLSNFTVVLWQYRSTGSIVSFY